MVHDNEMEPKMGGSRFIGDRVNGIYEHQGSFDYGRLGFFTLGQKHQNSHKSISACYIVYVHL